MADRQLAKAFSANPVDADGLKQALQSGAHPDRPLANGTPPLHAALARGELLAAAFLLAAGAEANAMDAEGATALELASSRGDRDGMRLLLEYFKTTGTGPAEEIWDRFSYQQAMDVVLIDAVKTGEVQRVRPALVLGADPEARSVADNFMHAPLHYAVVWGNWEVVGLLLEAGADPARRGANGETAADMMWSAPRQTLFTPEWERVFSLLHEKAGGDLFSPVPGRLTLDDLRQPVPVYRAEDMRLIHFLVKAGQTEKVIEILKTHPEQRLEVADFLVKGSSDRELRETLLTAFARAGALGRAFSTDIWQGRLEAVLELQKHAEKNPICLVNKVDFEAAAKAVLEYGQNELRQAARTKIPKLKPGGRMP